MLNIVLTTLPVGLHPLGQKVKKGAVNASAAVIPGLAGLKKLRTLHSKHVITRVPIRFMQCNYFQF